jgi:hypothetical protein
MNAPAVANRRQSQTSLANVNAPTLQAVDGVALKATVDMWSHASAANRPALFAAAQAVRQIEIGLDAVFSLSLALTTLAFAGVLWEARRAGRVLAGISLATAATAAVASVLFGLRGFSSAAMNAGMASGLLGIILTVAAAAWVRRRHRRTATHPYGDQALSS